MGFGTQRFVSAVDPNLVCGVCGGVLEDAVLTPCGHSFCCLCLHTWLARPAALTCPECRAPVSPDSVKPVHPLRNLIRGLDVQCEHSERGSGTAWSWPTTINCAGIAASVSEDDGVGHEDETHFDAAWREFRERVQTSKSASYTDVCILLSRIRALEARVERLLEELRSARNKNVTLEREYEKINAQLREKQNEIRELQDTDFFLEHECARTPETIARLSLLIARNLLQKPRYVEAEQVFSAVRRCYEKFHRTRPEWELRWSNGRALDF
nr:hypothetical protein BaRGS_008456 [Batillaria attramentaria]